MNEEVIFEIKLDVGDNEKTLDTLNALIAEQKQRVVDLNLAIATLSKTEGASSDQVIAITKRRDQLSNAVKANSSNQKNLVTVINSETTSVNSLKAQNSILLSQRNQLGTATENERTKVKQLNDAIDANTNAIKKQSSAAEQQRMNIGNYLKSVEIAGFSIEGIASKFASPYTAAGAALGGLFKLYAKSKQGAQDLEVAQVKLNAVFQLFADKVGALGEGKDGRGIFSKLADAAAFYFGGVEAYAASVAAELKLQADKEDQLLEIRRRRFAKFYTEQAEDQKLLRDDDTRTLQVRIRNAEEVLANVRASNKLVISTAKEQLDKANEQLAKKKQDIDLQLKQAIAEERYADISEANNKKENEALKALLKLRQQLAEVKPPKPQPRLVLEDENTQLALDRQYKEQQLRDKQNFLATTQSQEEFQTQQFNSYTEYLKKKIAAAKSYGKDTLTLETELADAQIAEAERGLQVTTKVNKAKEISAQDSLQVLDNTLGTSLALFKQDTVAFKVAATTKALIDAYLAANNALATGGPFASFAALAIGLANVVEISGIAAAGGADFYTDGPTMLLVGDNPGGVERVTVEPMSGKGKTRVFGSNSSIQPNIALAGGGSVEVNRNAVASSLVRSFNENLQTVQTVLVIQDYEMAATRKNQPVNRAKVISGK